MRAFKTLLALASGALLIAACGGGGGGVSNTTSSPGPQLIGIVSDWSSSSSAFADASQINVQIASETNYLTRILAGLRRVSIWPMAYAQTLPQCNRNIVPVVIENSGNEARFRSLRLTQTQDSDPCFVSSREVGDYVAAQARNLFQGGNRCDLVLIPKSGGSPHCFTFNLPEEVASRQSYQQLEILLNENEAGYQLSNLLNSQLTQNGRFFFAAFRLNEVQGIYRVSLDGNQVKGSIAYIRPPSKETNFLYDGGGYKAMENGDLIVGLSRSVAGYTNEVYYVSVQDVWQNLEAQRLYLVHTLASGPQDDFLLSLSAWGNSPLFLWAGTQWSQATKAGTMGAFFSSSDSSAGEKRFFTTIAVDRYQTLEVGATVLVRVTIPLSGTLVFEDFGPTSLGFSGSSWQSDNLDRVYTYDTASNPASFTVRELSNRSQNVQVSSGAVVNPEVTIPSNITVANNPRQLATYVTRNFIFFGVVSDRWFNNTEDLPTSIYVIDKRGYTNDQNLISGLNAVDLAGLSPTNQNLSKVYPSLTGDKLVIRLRDVTSNLDISAEVSPTGVENIINLGSFNAIPDSFAIVAGR